MVMVMVRIRVRVRVRDRARARGRVRVGPPRRAVHALHNRRSLLGTWEEHPTHHAGLQGEKLCGPAVGGVLQERSSVALQGG